jgi:glycosyltransferase involved in cell wall biosynthesis
MKVSVIVPCYNEERYIASCLESIVEGLAGVNYSYEILVVDGGSSDLTVAEIRRVATGHPIANIRVIDNLHRFQVHGLNLGIAEAAGEFIVRCDAHSVYPRGYVDRLVQLLGGSDERTGNVGTPHINRPGGDGAMARSIAHAMTSRIAVGISHRTIASDEAIEVDTLLFGAWRRSVLEKVGTFDSDFVRGQDLEHNLRLKGCGYKVVLHPGEPFVLFARPTLSKLAQMVRQYAAAKMEIAARTVGYQVRRSLIPAFFFIVMLLLLLTPAFWVLPAIYGLCIALFSTVSALKNKDLGMLALVVVVPCMHVSHALGTTSGWWSAHVMRRAPRQWSGTR